MASSESLPRRVDASVVTRERPNNAGCPSGKLFTAMLRVTWQQYREAAVLTRLRNARLTCDANSLERSLSKRFSQFP
jgi:hypothetical protein